MEHQELLRTLLIRDSNVRAYQFALKLQQVKAADIPYLDSPLVKTIKRLTMECPFNDIQEMCLNFLRSHSIVTSTQTFDDHDYHSISDYIRNDTIKFITNLEKDQQTSPIFIAAVQEVFYTNARIAHYERLMAHYPEFLMKHCALIRELFERPGPLLSEWQYYIAFMAAATHQCEYLMLLIKERCGLFQGNCRWFDSPEYMDERFKALGVVNVKLAHRPWDFSPADYRNLLKYWNHSELLQALIIMSVFHSYSSFVFGLGVNEEYDIQLSRPRSCMQQDKYGTHLQRHPQKSWNLHKRLLNVSVSGYISEEVTEESEDDTSSFQESHQFQKTSEPMLYEETTDNDYFSGFAGGYLPYSDVEVASSNRSVHPSDFNFRDQGYNIIEKYLPELAECLLDIIQFTQSLTSNTIGSEKVDVITTPFRQAVWMYTQRVYGLEYDDYSYNMVNYLICSINTKKYLKKVICIPHQVTHQDYSDIDLDLTDDEIIHVNLLVCEARLEALLIYITHTFYCAMLDQAAQAKCQIISNTNVQVLL